MLNTTAAALVSETKTLCFPANVDSIAIDTTEDHVSMGSGAARKAAAVIENVTRVLALELACASQALELHGTASASPAAGAAWAVVREEVPFVIDDRGLSSAVAALSARVAPGDVVAAAERALGSTLA